MAFIFEGVQLLDLRYFIRKTSLTKKYNFAILSGEKICFDGFWEAESQYLGTEGDERGGLKVLSAVVERILTHPPPSPHPP